MAKPVGSICLYGANHCGHGYLAGGPGNPAQFGDGEPHVHLTATSAYWLAAYDLKDAGIVGPIEVYAPGGQYFAIVDNSKAGGLPYFGQLNWQPAAPVEISFEAIEAAAAGQAN